MSNNLNESIQPIRSRLRDLRSSLIRWIVLNAAGRIALLCGLLFVVDAAADYWFRFDLPQRTLLLSLMGVVVAWRVWRDLLRPLSHLPDEDALCGQAASPAAWSALELGRDGSPGASPELMAIAVERGVKESEGIQGSRVLDGRVQGRSVLSVALVIGLAVAAFLLAPAASRTWAGRNLLLGNAMWPQRTHLAFDERPDDGVLFVPKGETVQVDVSVTGKSKVPGSARLVTEGGEILEMAQVGDRSFRGRVPHVGRMVKVRAEGGDGITRWLTLRPVGRPEIEGLTVEATWPDYTGRPAEQLELERDVHDILEGTRLKIRGRSSSGSLASVTTLLNGATPVESTIDGDQFTARLDVDSLQQRSISLSLTDTNGFTSARPQSVRIRPLVDRAPVVRVSLEGIGTMITPVAHIPVRHESEDDFGIAERQLLVDVRPGAGGEPARLSHALEDSALKVFDLSTAKAKVGDVIGLHVSATDTKGQESESQTWNLRVVEESELRADLLRREQQLRHELEGALASQKSFSRLTAALAEDWGGQIAADASQARRDQLHGARLCAEIEAKYRAVADEMVNNRLEDENSESLARVRGRIIEPLASVSSKDMPAAAAHLGDVLRNDLPEPRRRAALDLAIQGQVEIIAQLEEIINAMAEIGFRQSLALYDEVLDAQENVNTETGKAADEAIEDIFDN